ncbi:MAG: tripartite tricarboxylate transporter substrate binding protein [Betaproteobacteria bacterium]|nr:tripartite tricarboxylate transporter substrate binding protein [Betaproteobacteria bacterium]
MPTAHARLAPAAVLSMSVLSLAGLSSMPDVAFAQAYPAKPIRMIVPFPPGGNTDIIARGVATRMQELLGQTFVIENRGGAGSTIGTEVLARSPADGYVVGFVSSAHVFNAAILPKLPYDSIKDFTMLGVAADVPTMIVAHPSLPVKSVRELAALARKNPGKLNYASSGAGTVGHLAMELLSSMNGGSYVHVPYKGSGQAITDVVGGYVILMAASMPVFVSHVQAGKLRPLGVTSAKRSRALPDVPTIAEQGFPGYEVSSGFGMLAPANVPAAVVKTINGALVKAVQDPAVRDRLSSQGAEPVGSTPEQHDQLVRSEIARWTKIVKQVGIKVDGS